MSAGKLRRKANGKVVRKANGKLARATAGTTGCCCGFYPLINCADDVVSEYTITAAVAAGHLAEIFQRTADGVCYYVGELTQTAGTDAGAGTWFPSCETCGFRVFTKCADGTETAYKIAVGDAASYPGVYLVGGECIRLGGSTTGPANPPGGTEYDDCDDCLEVSEEPFTCDPPGVPVSFSITVAGANGGMCFDYIGGILTARTISTGNADGTWTVPLAGLNPAPMGLGILFYEPPYDVDPTPGVSLPDHGVDCHSTGTTLTQQADGFGRITVSHLGGGVYEITAYASTVTVPGGIPGNEWLVWRVLVPCRTGADDPRGNTTVVASDICYAPFNGAATCGGTAVVTINWA